MVRGSSQSQTSQTPATRPGTAPPRGSAAATASLRRRTGSGSGSRSTGGSSSFSGSAAGNSNMLRFYTDDAPGMKISPTVVLVLSLCFIGFVATLHVAGKLYLHRSGPAGT